MNDEHKHDNHGNKEGVADGMDPKDRYEELGQQAGAVFGQLFSAAEQAAEQFGKQVSKESHAWSRSQEPFLNSLRQAGDEFRTAAGRAAENLSDAMRNSPDNPANRSEEPVADPLEESADLRANAGSTRRIGGGAMHSGQQSRRAPFGSEAQENHNKNRPEDPDSTTPGDQRVARLAEMFVEDRGLSELTGQEFESLQELLRAQYHGIRAFQDRSRR